MVACAGLGGDKAGGQAAARTQSRVRPGAPRGLWSLLASRPGSLLPARVRPGKKSAHALGWTRTGDARMRANLHVVGKQLGLHGVAGLLDGGRVAGLDGLLGLKERVLDLLGHVAAGAGRGGGVHGRAVGGPRPGRAAAPCCRGRRRKACVWPEERARPTSLPHCPGCAAARLQLVWVRTVSAPGLAVELGAKLVGALHGHSPAKRGGKFRARSSGQGKSTALASR
jgi:hypothetical protein